VGGSERLTAGAEVRATLQERRAQGGLERQGPRPDSSGKTP